MQNQKTFDYKDREYDVVPYDTNWQKRFATEAEAIMNIFGNDIQIEHVGSTSVRGMNGKPCIDVLVITKNLEIVKEHVKDMENAGYVFRGAYISDDALLFSRARNNVIETNVHFLPEGNQHIEEMLSLRDYLRNHPEEVSEYSELKKNIYEKYPNDYAGYRKEKDAYMEKLKDRAKKTLS